MRLLLFRLFGLCVFYPLVALAEDRTARVSIENLPPDLFQTLKAEGHYLYDLYENLGIDQKLIGFSISQPVAQQNLFLISYGNPPHCEVFYEFWLKKDDGGPYSLADSFMSCGQVTIQEHDPLVFKIVEPNPVLSHALYHWTGERLDISYEMAPARTTEVPLHEMAEPFLYDVLADAEVQERLLRYMSSEDLVKLGHQTGAQYPAEVMGDYLIAHSCVRPRKCDFTSATVAINLETDGAFAVLREGNHLQIWGDIDPQHPLPQKLQDYIATGRW